MGFIYYFSNFFLKLENIGFVFHALFLCHNTVPMLWPPLFPFFSNIFIKVYIVSIQCLVIPGLLLELEKTGSNIGLETQTMKLSRVWSCLWSH